MPGVRTVIITLLIISTAIGTARAANVRIHARADVRDAVVRLSDVADVADDDAETQKRISHVVLGPAPPRGKTVKLGFETIRRGLRAAGVDTSAVRFQGRNSVLVSRTPAASSVVQAGGTAGLEFGGGDRRRELAEKTLAEAVEARLKRIAPQLSGLRASIEVDDGDVAGVLALRNAAFGVDGFQEPLDRPQQLTASGRDRSGAGRKVRFTAHLSRKPYVLAAKQTIPRGEVVQAAHLIWKQVDAVGDGCTDVKLVVGSEARQTIAEDAVVKREAIRRIPLVRPNDLVTVNASRGGVTVSKTMKARRAGALGDTIVLVELKRREQVLARVTGLHEAEVIFTGSRELRVGDDSIRFNKRPDTPRTQQPRPSGRPDGRSIPADHSEPQRQSQPDSQRKRQQKRQPPPFPAEETMNPPRPIQTIEPPTPPVTGR